MDRRGNRSPRPGSARRPANLARAACRTSYSPTISDQSVSCQVGASACTAAIAACTAYRVGGLRRSASVSSATPSAISSRSQRVRSCSDSSSIRPSADRRVPARASVSSSRASRAPISASCGMSRCSRRARPTALSTRSRRTRWAPAGAVCPVVKIRCTTSRTAPSRSPSWSARRYPVRDPRGGDLLLGPGDPRGHGRFLYQERPCHLGRGQSADQSQGERDLSVAGQGRVTAGEDQAQPVVVGELVVRPGGRRLGDQQRHGPAEHDLAAQHVEGPVARDGREPGARAARGCRTAPSVCNACAYAS